MTVFEFLLALYAIVAGLGVSLLVTSVGQLIEARDRVRLYWVHSCWIALTFVGHVVSWFTIWRFHEHAPWTVLQALLLLSVPILLYHSPPLRIMKGMLANVSTLLITVGLPHKPFTDG